MDLVLLLLRVLLAAALYLFLGAILLFLWRNLNRPVGIEAVAQRHRGRLVVVGGNAENDQEGELEIGAIFPLQPVTSLGRSAVNTVTIPDAYASSEHALLVYRGGQWWLEDRGSRNGTILNTLIIDGPTVVSAGDVIEIGQVKLKFEIVNS